MAHIYIVVYAYSCWLWLAISIYSIIGLLKSHKLSIRSIANHNSTGFSQGECSFNYYAIIFALSLFTFFLTFSKWIDLIRH